VWGSVWVTELALELELVLASAWVRELVSVSEQESGWARVSVLASVLASVMALVSVRVRVLAQEWVRHSVQVMEREKAPGRSPCLFAQMRQAAFGRR
jgi:hypothetical protein